MEEVDDGAPEGEQSGVEEAEEKPKSQFIVTFDKKKLKMVEQYLYKLIDLI